MKAAFALLAVAATLAFAAVPGFARTDPGGAPLNGHVGRTLLDPSINTTAPPVSHSQGSRFNIDTLAPNGGKPVTATAKISFSWSDAGVGAAMAAGTILALIGVLLIVTRRRSSLAAV
jgi:hypothetical protein